MKGLGKPLPARPWEANPYLLALGIGMIVAGVAIPGSQAGTVSLLIILGAGVAVAGVLSNRFSQLEIGPQGIKVTQEDGAPMPVPWLAAEADGLSEIAQIVLGDPVLAGKVVEDAISRVRQHRKDIPRSRLDLATIRTLIALLERAENKRWLSGSKLNAQDKIAMALLELPLSARVAFALSVEFPAIEVAGLVERPEDDVLRDIEAARAVIAPNLGRAEGRSDD